MQLSNDEYYITDYTRYTWNYTYKPYYEWSKNDFMSLFKDTNIMNDFQLSLLEKCDVKAMRQSFLVPVEYEHGDLYHHICLVFINSPYKILADVYKCRYFINKRERMRLAAGLTI